MIVYTPAADFNGTDSFTYTVTDGSLTADAVVTVTVAAVNDDPSFVGGDAAARSVPENAAAGDNVGAVLAVSDPDDGDTLVFALSGAGHGNFAVAAAAAGAQLAVAAGASLDHETAPSYTLTVSVSDGRAGDNSPDASVDDTIEVTVAVTDANDAPFAVDDAAATVEDAAVEVAVTANDTDPDGDSLEAAVKTQPANGAAAVKAGSGGAVIVYTPAADFNGTDSFTYTVTDGSLTADAVVTVTVAAVNDDPSFVGGDAAARSVPENAAAGDNVGAVLAVSDPDDGDTLVFALSGAGHGNFAVAAAAAGAQLAVAAGASLDHETAPSYTLTVSVSDGRAGDNSADASVDDTIEVTVAVTDANDAPFAVDDAAATVEDAAVEVAVTANDTDPDGDSLEVSAVKTQPANGAAAVKAGSGGAVIVYTPAADFNGTDSFTYTVTDGSLTADAVVTVTVAAVNDDPSFVGGDAAARSVPENAAAGDNVGAVLAVSDPDDGDTLVFALSGAGHGNFAVAAAAAGAQLAVAAGASLDHETAPSYTLTVSVSDGRAGDNSPDASVDDTIEVTVAVTDANDAPFAVDDAAATVEDAAVEVAVTANDTDPDGDSLEAAVKTQPANGAAAVKAGSGGAVIVYTPAADFNGTDSFTYTVTDGSLTADAVVTVTVAAVNDDPSFVGGDAAARSVPENAAAGDNVGAVLAVSDPDDGDTLVFALSGAGHGNFAVAAAAAGAQLAVAAGASLDHETAPSYTLTVSVSDGRAGDNSPDASVDDTIEVTVAVTDANDAPFAVDDAAATVEDAAVEVAVTANDTDPDGDSLEASAVKTQPANGAAAVKAGSGGAVIVYTPAADFNGTDSFTYTVTDGSLTADAVVTVTVAAVNDDPSFVGGDAAARSVPENAAAGDNVGAVLAVSDPDDGDTLVFALSGAGHGNFAVAAAAAGAQLAVAAGASLDHETAPSYTLTVSVSDGRAGDNSPDASVDDTIEVTVAVTDANDAPFAVDDAAATVEDAAVEVAVTANDTDPDGDSLEASAVKTQPANGAAAVKAGSGAAVIVYTPAADFNGTDSFTYTVTDGSLTADAVVTVTVAAVNDDPSFVGGDAAARRVAEDAAAGDNVGAVLAVSDPDDGDTLVFALSGAGHGNFAVAAAAAGAQLAVAAGASLDYETAPSYTLTVSVSDGRAGDNSPDASVDDTIEVTVAVTDANDAPFAVDDAAATVEDAAVEVAVTANDTDPDGDSLEVSAVKTQPANGAAAVKAGSGAAVIVYTPAADFNGTDSFTYTVTDGSLTADAVVTVEVAAVNDDPSFVGGDAAARSVPEDAAAGDNVGAVLAVSDPDDGDTLVFALSGAGHGNFAVAAAAAGAQLAVAAGASLDHETAPSYTLTVSVSDGRAGDNSDDASVDDTIEVTVAVTDANDAPFAVGDAASTVEDAAVEVAVTANDTDPDGDSLEVSAVKTQPANGAAAVKAGSGGAVIVYTPAADFNGTDSFTYTVTDGSLTADADPVTVTVAWR